MLISCCLPDRLLSLIAEDAAIDDALYQLTLSMRLENRVLDTATYLRVRLFAKYNLHEGHYNIYDLFSYIRHVLCRNVYPDVQIVKLIPSYPRYWYHLTFCLVLKISIPVPWNWYSSTLYIDTLVPLKLIPSYLRYWYPSTLVPWNWYPRPWYWYPGSFYNGTASTVPLHEAVWNPGFDRTGTPRGWPPLRRVTNHSTSRHFLFNYAVAILLTMPSIMASLLVIIAFQTRYDRRTSTLYLDNL